MDSKYFRPYLTSGLNCAGAEFLESAVAALEGFLRDHGTGGCCALPKPYMPGQPFIHPLLVELEDYILEHLVVNL